MKSVGVFINISNIYHTVNEKFQNRKLHYDRYLRRAIEDCILHKAYAYGTRKKDTEAVSFINCLKSYGYEPKYKNRNFNWNVGMTIDIVNSIDQIDICIIGTNDPSIIPLMEWIKNREKQCHVFACNIPNEVKTVANLWTEIDSDLLELNKLET